MDEALEAYGALLPVLDSVRAGGVRVSGIGGLLPSLSVQRERIDAWNAFVDEYGGKLCRLVDSLSAGKGFVEGAFEGFRKIIEGGYEPEEAGFFSLITEGPAANYLVRTGKSMVVTVLNVPEGRVEEVEDIVAAGLPDGHYKLGVNDVVVVDGDAKLASTGVRAGSTLSQDTALRNIMAFTGHPAEDVIPLLSENPARAVGIFDRKGSIETGKDADFAVFDADWTVRRTIVGGATVYQA